MRLRRWSVNRWLLLTLAVDVLLVALLLAVCSASFGTEPIIPVQSRVWVGEVFLIVAGVIGTAVASAALVRALIEPRGRLRALVVCVPSLIYSLSHVWAWGMFVGWA